MIREARKLPFDAFPKFERAKSGKIVKSRKSDDGGDWASFWSFCGYDLLDLSLGETGFVSSPNHPAKYGPNRRCLWNLQVRTPMYILIYKIGTDIRPTWVSGLWYYQWEDTPSR